MALYSSKLGKAALDAAKGWVPEQLGGEADGDDAASRRRPEAAGDGSGGGAGGSTPPMTTAAATASALPTVAWGAISFVAFVAALFASLVWFQDGDPDSPVFVPPEGLAVFALFYVVAQAAERLVALVLGAIRWLPGLDKPSVLATRDHAVAVADVGAREPGESLTLAQQAAAAQAKVDQVRNNRAAVAFGLTAAIAMLVCGYVDADFLSAVGVEFGAWSTPDKLLAMVVTGLVVGGGSKQLNDLIGTISKKNAEKSTPVQTGGKA